MRTTLLSVAAFLACFFAFQGPVYSQEEFGKNFIGAKVLFIDYGRPNGADSLNITNGLEVFYQRNLNDWISVAVPMKAGVVNVVGEIDNRRIIGFDGILKIHYYKPMARLVPYILGGAGIVLEEFEDSNFQFPLGAGLDIRVGKNSYINLQGEYRISTADDRNNLQGGIGFVYRLGKAEPDTDRDGIPDKEDACPTEPGPEATRGCPDRDGDGVIDKSDECPDDPGPAATNGCPDNDNDGIRNRDDQCPDEAGPVATNGCPDRDNDGVIDRFDQCPDEYGLPANNGCPLSDRDGDSIPDEADLCPDVPGPAATRGCPDRDGDGFADRDDRCPDQPGSISGCPDSDGDGLIDPDDKCPQEAGPVSNQGCPEIKEEDQEVLRVAMRDVQFETGKATLLNESLQVLDQVVEIMERYPSYKLRISGHTDSVGDESSNQVLSEERAKACYQYLTSKGVSPSRMTFFGFGETQPIASNRTAQGRRLNRRVEFELYIE